MINAVGGLISVKYKVIDVLFEVIYCILTDSTEPASFYSALPNMHLYSELLFVFAEYS